MTAKAPPSPGGAFPSVATVLAEASVSLPGIVGAVVRPERVRVAFQDLDGRDQTLSADGLLSVCLQHEIDQLDGVFWLQRLSRLRRDRILKRIAKGDA